MTEPAYVPRTNVLALVGFITAFVVPLAGLVLSIMATRQLRVLGDREGGRGLARWGTIVGAAGVLLHTAFVVVWLMMFTTLTTGGTIGG